MEGNNNYPYFVPQFGVGKNPDSYPGTGFDENGDPNLTAGGGGGGAAGFTPLAAYKTYIELTKGEGNTYTGTFQFEGDVDEIKALAGNQYLAILSCGANLAKAAAGSLTIKWTNNLAPYNFAWNADEAKYTGYNYNARTMYFDFVSQLSELDELTATLQMDEALSRNPSAECYLYILKQRN